MNEIDDLIFSFIKDLNYKPISDMLEKLKSGKKLRSKLLLAIAPKNSKAIQICAIIELIHLASLLHDDVIDEAKLRRGTKSVNAEFGAKNAIMLGDILYSKAFFELSKIDINFAKIISESVVKLSLGELMDVRLSECFNSDKEIYLQMIYNKTAALIEASAKCGAILAGLDEKDFGEYGKNLGIAFQIVDDILDITSDEKTLGKPAMSDFKEGKTTLPYILLYQKTEQKNELKSLFKKELNEKELSWLKKELSSVLEQSFDEAKNYANKAKNAIKAYNKADLEEIIEKMIVRAF